VSVLLLEAQHVLHGRPNGRIVLVRLAVLRQPAQPLPPEPPCHTDGLRHSPCSSAEAAYDSAAAASARRSSAEGSVADAALSAACAERSKASRPSLCHWALLSLPLVSALENNGLENRPPSANSQLYLRHPAKPLAARRSNVPPATSYTFAIFSPSTSIYLCRPLRGGLPSTCSHALPQDHRQADGFPDGVRARRKHAAV